MPTIKLTNKTLLELVLLVTISRRSHSAPEIFEQLENVDFKTPEGSLYPLLSNLRSQKMIDSRLEEMDTGSIKKCYFLTERGLTRLKKLKRDWHAINRIISKTISTSSKAH